LDSRSNLSGKVCLVTGATSGDRGGHRRGACAAGGDGSAWVGRSREKMCRDRRSDPGARPATRRSSSWWPTSPCRPEIRRLAGEFRGRHARLDVLVNNAGGDVPRAAGGRRRHRDDLRPEPPRLFPADRPPARSPQGRRPRARVVSVSSDAHRWPRRIDLDDYQGRRRYGGLRGVRPIEARQCAVHRRAGRGGWRGTGRDGERRSIPASSPQASSRGTA